MKRFITVLSILGFMAVSASAQTSHSAYFLDNYSYSYRLNPSLLIEKGFIGLGGTANLNSDLGVSSLLYPAPDGSGLVTGLNSAISSEEFLSNIKDANAIDLDAGVTLFSLGARSINSMTNFEINVRALGNAALPGDLFRFLKNGSSDSAYDLSTTDINAQAYAEIAFGKAFRKKKFTWGFRVKGIFGLANLDLQTTKALLTSTDTQISAETDIRARLACAPVSLKKDGDKLSYELIPNSIKPCGYGAAVDLGITWAPFKGLTLSAGINDLGGAYWMYNNILAASGNASFDGLDLSKTNDVQGELNAAKDELLKMADFKVLDATESEFGMLPFSANAGVRYRLPIINFLSVGAFGTYNYSPVNPTWDARVGATLTLFRGLSLTGNYGWSNFGNVCGAGLSLSLLFLNAFVTVDGYSGPIGMYNYEDPNMHLTVPFPVDSFRYRINFGVTFQLGRRFLHQ